MDRGRESVMKVKDVMTTKVISVEPNATVLKAARLMLQNRISGLPVLTKGGELVGIVTEGDFLRRSELDTRKRRSLWHDILVGPGRLAEEYVKAHGRQVHDLMTHDPCTVTEDTPLEDVVALMEKRGVKRFPVVKDGRVVGIVSRSNLLRGLAAIGPVPVSSETSDETIKAHLSRELDQERWAALGTVEVIVRNGVVHLWGAITDERERQALIVAAENTPGAISVRDHLSWFEPYSGVVIPPDADDASDTAAA